MIPRMTHEASYLLQQNADESASWGKAEPTVVPTPVTTSQRSNNPLRPSTFAEMIGQHKAVTLMSTIIDRAIARDAVLDHVLLIAASGTGKSTFSHVIANELGVNVWEVEAPVSLETLLGLREAMQRGDILRIEEVHQQAIMERRGKSTSTQPEVLYAIMEDRTVTTGTEVLPFPEITVIGTTTDEGMLPDPFINRFPFRPKLAKYTVDEMKLVVEMNADKLGITMDDVAMQRFANASRCIPRECNNLVRNAAAITDHVDNDMATTVIRDLNDLTDDGLTLDMQNMLTFLFTRAKASNMQGEVKFQASVSTISTALGKSRDTKAIPLRVEPYLIEKGYVQVGHGGRKLTDDGIKRAKELLP